MKKIVLVLLLVTIAVLPIAAKSNLINIGYNIQNDWWTWDDVKLRSLSLNFTHVGGDSAGFYMQINPYVGLSFKENGIVYKMSETMYSVFGSSFIFGFGGDLNFGAIGLLLGGGLYMDAQYTEFSGYYSIDILAGGGIGANIYFQPGSGNLIINAGLNLAWHPWGYATSSYYLDDSYYDTSMTTANFNIGIGWRIGGTQKDAPTDW